MEKKMNNNDDKENKEFIHWQVYVIVGIIIILFAIRFIWFCGNVYINGADFITKISTFVKNNQEFV